MEWTTFACLSDLCEGVVWSVRRAEGPGGLWRVSYARNAPGSTVAAPAWLAGTSLAHAEQEAA